MKISECSQGREFGSSWQFWGKIHFWIWSDSNNNAQDHCETFWEGTVNFFPFLSPAHSPQGKPLSHWNITLAEGRLPIKELPSKGTSEAAGVDSRAVMGTSALLGPAAARHGTRNSPRLLHFSRAEEQCLSTASRALGSLGSWRARCLYLPGAEISLLNKESITIHLCKSTSNAAPSTQWLKGGWGRRIFSLFQAVAPTQRLWVVFVSPY